MEKSIGIGTVFTTSYEGMSVTSANSTVYETWEVVEALDNGYRCELRSSNAVMEVNQSYGRQFSERDILNAMK
jgi:hypothetical protein